MSELTARGLTHLYGGPVAVLALDGLDLDVAAGSVTAVLGPSGCGKTTLLRVLAGTERPAAGTLVVGGRPLVGTGRFVAPERRGIGLVPQEGALFPHLDVGRNVGFGLRREPRDRRARRVAEMLELVGMAGFAERRPHELSGGQQQRVALARALAPSPSVVLLDEPFSALDTGLRAAVRQDVMATIRAAGATCVLVTHDQTEAMAVADAVAVMRAGRIVQAGPPLEVYRFPADLWTARFVGDAVVVPGRREGATVVTDAFGPLPLAPGAPHAEGPEVAVLLRPEQVRPARGDARARARVEQVQFYGSEGAVRLALGGRVVDARWPSVELPRVGDEVDVTVQGPVFLLPGPAAGTSPPG